MDRGRTDRNKIRSCGNSNVTEHEYAVVDDQKEVRIFPARPINDEQEYADRNLPRSSSAQSLSSLTTSNFNLRPTCQPRETTHTTGPAVNRELKPGRRKTKLDKRSTPVQPGDQHIHRFSPSPPPFTKELVSNLPELTLQESCRKEEQQNTTKKAEFSSHTKGLLRAERVFVPHANQRHSLDLDTIENADKRSQQSLERVPSKRHHHEWPQTKEDFEQHEFVPIQKPQQTYCEEHWYVGACNRADAEHALHLVNKDGAFLVRDCSINSSSEPLVLAVYHEKKVYNVKIRFIESKSKYTLGYRSNDMFDSVAEIIKFHSIFPIVLISGRNTGSKYPENCVLTCPITKRDVDQLLQ
ncbi:cytokine-dependent hematopoietic cell linker [Mastacembelus armatus]|uniref:Cytokine dependent hematopoietic cell linker n=1 Tax=Mastacembelus armatus TaxID=205130 RepID=A0A3Q3N7V9_9TELE|nr:cytokine-dependent hematopoietic cell linker [Mastacembelus armatus]